jgi:predicted aminopeptidase
LITLLEGGWLAMCLRAVFAALLLLLGGCADLGYYLQSVQGQMEVNAARRPLDATLADDATAPVLKRRLQRAAAIRAFAIDTLKLPDNASYRSYADLQRPYVVWNVWGIAAIFRARLPMASPMVCGRPGWMCTLPVCRRIRRSAGLMIRCSTPSFIIPITNWRG